MPQSSLLLPPTREGPAVSPSVPFSAHALPYGPRHTPRPSQLTPVLTTGKGFLLLENSHQSHSPPRLAPHAQGAAFSFPPTEAFRTTPACWELSSLSLPRHPPQRHHGCLCHFQDKAFVFALRASLHTGLICGYKS